MNENSLRNARVHNTVVVIITIACIGAVIESISQGWEFWVPPLIVCGLIAVWVLHVTQYGSWSFRENFYLIFTMLVAFYHGVHPTSFLDVGVTSALVMVTMTLLKRKEFILFLLVEYIFIMAIQIFMLVRFGDYQTDPGYYLSRIATHLAAVLCTYRALSEIIRNNRKDKEELELRNSEKESARVEMEDFLVNISHELRTPVNVINGVSTLILRKEQRDDVVSIQEAGVRLSRQIEDIQDYSEIQRGDVVLEESKYMITSLLNDTIAAFQSWKKNKDLDFIVDLDPSLPSVMRGDVGKISKVIRHLLDNSVKFTKRGGIYLRVSGIRREYGINLSVEVTDTGIGMSRGDIDKISRGLYRGDKKRNRATGGIGLGFSIVYGFVRTMNGFVNIESRKGRGTTVRVSLAQEIIDPAPCISVDSDRLINMAFHAMPGRTGVPELRDFYRNMATNLASGLRINLYFAANTQDLDKLLERGDITHVFLSSEAYSANSAYYDGLSKNADGPVLAVSAPDGFRVRKGSRVIVMSKPVYGVPISRVLSGDTSSVQLPAGDEDRRPILDGLRALVVDDEPMNLVVASGLFREYNMTIDTAESGREAIDKFGRNEYDLVFMDHMMPEMDGVEAMKRLREIAEDQGRVTRVIALTANAISGAKEMFMREGFDGFISKPIDITEFERVMNQVMSPAGKRSGGGVA